MKFQELIVVTTPNGGVETVFLADRDLLDETQEAIADSKNDYYGENGKEANSFEDVLKENLKTRKIMATFIPYVEMPE